jgi:hypothetical protein
MELLWMAVGAGLLGLVLWFRATKRQVKDAAYTEVALMLVAVENAEKDPTQVEAAMDHVATYMIRAADAQAHPARIPADRSLLASYWREALIDARFLKADGGRVTDHPVPVAFWDAVDRLQHEIQRRALVKRFEPLGG